MSIPAVRIIRGQGALGRPLPGQDYISGLIFYSDTLPSGFAVDPDNIKQVLSVAAAEALGILNDYSDETQGKGTIQITAAGATNDTITAYFLEPDGTTTTLGSYTVLPSDTATLIATGLKNAINILTPTHGYSAISSTDTITVTFREGLGIYPNTGTPLSTVIVGTVTNTIVQSTVDGVASLLSQWHYHISEYFRLNPQGNLFVGFFPITAQTWNFAEIVSMQSFAKGIIRQLGIYLGNVDDFDSAADILTIADACQVQKLALDAVHAPLSIIFAPEISGIADLTTLSDLNVKDDFGVSVTIGQDGDAVGFGIFKATGKSIGDVGAQLGAESIVAVNQDRGCLDYVNFTDGAELSVPCYANGVRVDLINAGNLATQLNNYRYIFLMQNVGFEGAGTTINDNHTACSVSSDYAYSNDNRVFDKMSRLLYSRFVPILKSTIQLNENGTLQATTVAFYNTEISAALNPMTTADPVTGNQEIAGEVPTIDPDQNVLATNKLVISVKATPQGVARNIEIGVSF